MRASLRIPKPNPKFTSASERAEKIAAAEVAKIAAKKPEGYLNSIEMEVDKEMAREKALEKEKKLQRRVEPEATSTPVVRKKKGARGKRLFTQKGRMEPEDEDKSPSPSPVKKRGRLVIESDEEEDAAHNKKLSNVDP